MTKSWNEKPVCISGMYSMTGPWIIGTAPEAKARIEALKSRGVDHLMLWFMDAPETDGMAFFMEEVAPAFRRELASAGHPA